MLKCKECKNFIRTEDRVLYCKALKHVLESGYAIKHHSTYCGCFDNKK